jgi:hypothetical protein
VRAKHGLDDVLALAVERRVFARLEDRVELCQRHRDDRLQLAGVISAG